MVGLCYEVCMPKTPLAEFVVIAPNFDPEGALVKAESERVAAEQFVNDYGDDLEEGQLLYVMPLTNYTKYSVVAKKWEVEKVS